MKSAMDNQDRIQRSKCWVIFLCGEISTQLSTSLLSRVRRSRMTSSNQLLH